MAVGNRRIWVIICLLAAFGVSEVFAQTTTRRRRTTRRSTATVQVDAGGFLSRDLEKVLFDSLSADHKRYSGYLFQADADTAAENLLLHLIGTDRAFEIVVKNYAEYTARLGVAHLLQQVGGDNNATLSRTIKTQTQQTLIGAFNEKYARQRPARRVFNMIRQYPVKAYTAPK